MTTPQQAATTAIQTAVNNPGTIARATQSLGTGCGTGSGIAAVTSAVNSATTALNNAINTLTSLPGLIQAQVNSVVNSALSNVLGEIRNATDPVLREINTLLSVLNNPTAFLAQWLRMQNLFPNLDLRQLFDDLLRGVGICQAASNAGGGPAQSPPSTAPATAAPSAVPPPSAPNPGTSPNSSIPSQGSATTPQATVERTAAQTLERLRQEALRQEIASEQVTRYRLRLERFFTSDPAERQRLAEEITAVETRISELGRSGNQTQ